MTASKEYSTIVGPDPELVYGIFDPGDSNAVSIITRSGHREGIALNLASLLTSAGLIAAAATEQGDVGNAVLGTIAGLQIRSGVHTTLDADDTVVTGLAEVLAVVVSMESDPVDGAMFVTGVMGNQAGAPAAGSIQIKTWQITSDADSTLIAATTFTKLVHWVAIGTG